jgi:membrane dipeptidase
MVFFSDHLLGLDLVAELNRRGILIDVSHASDAAVHDVLGESRSPIVASHSNSRAVCDNPRNLPDDLVQGIADGGGLVCVSLYPTLVADSAPTLQDVLKHIDHLVSLVGIEHVGVGTDYVDYATDILSDTLERADPGRILYGAVQSHVYPASLETVAKLGNLTQGLFDHGYSRAQLNDLLRGNFVKLLAATDKHVS